MNIRILMSRAAAISFIALGFPLLSCNALASGTSTSDLIVLAEQGNAMAQRILGERYAMGSEGAPKDMSQAIFWWQKAAEKRDAMAQFNLGVAYRRGISVPQDFVQAHMWFSIAAASGKETASGLLGKKKAESERKAVEDNMSPKQIEESRALAQIWLAKHG